MTPILFEKADLKHLNAFKHLYRQVAQTVGGLARLEEELTDSYIVRESNAKAIALYEKLGFVKEGALKMRIKNENNSFESDIPMGWMNPNYKGPL